MANGESELDVGRKELTLDRPPSLSNSPNSSPNSLKRDLALKHDDSLMCPSPLTVNNDDILQQIKASQSLDSSSEDITENTLSVKNETNENDEETTEKILEPLLNSELKEERVNGLIDSIKDSPNDENKRNEEETIFHEDHYSNESPINDSTKENSSKRRLSSNSGNQSPSKPRYFHSKDLTSCLKKAKPPQESPHQSEAKRNVNFPGYDNYVKEFIDPVDPWRNVQTPSKGEVISFYKNSCQKQKTKANEKVIKQIQDITDLSIRASTLVLRGSRMDNRSCEALESIFRRIQFENLDLENCSLEEDGATALLEMIEFYHSTCKLNIACNPKIGMRGWQALCRMLRKTPCLTYLDARRTLLTDMTMPTFGRCLKADPPLKILHLEGVFLSGRPMLILTTAMKYNKILEELYLGDNDLSSSDGSPIGAMLTYNTTLQLLDLRNNQIKDVGLAHVCNGLSDQSEQNHGGLCSLILWNNGLTHEGMTYLTEGLVHTQSLKALNLGHNRVGDFGVQKLKSGLIKNKSLHKLGFLNTKLGSEGAVALAEVLADSLCITRIDIRENNIQTAGLMAFSMALKVNQSLLRLDLDKDIRKEPGMEQVMQTVLVDIYNFCHRNKQLARQSLTQSMASSISSNEPSATTNITRQASTESNSEYDCIVSDDVFHPEGGKQPITPFSPVFTDQKQMSMKFPLHFDKGAGPSEPTTNAQQIPHTQKELISAISSSPPAIPKETGVHILNKPPANSSERRANRFSVTKILDSLGNHAAGVANKIANVTSLDSKLKKQTPKDAVSIAEAHSMDVKTVETKTNPNSKQIETESERNSQPGTQSEQTSLSLDCTTKPPPNDDHMIYSPMEIIDVNETNDPLGLREQSQSSESEAVKETLKQESTSLETPHSGNDILENGLSKLVSEVTIDETVSTTTSSDFDAQKVDDGDEVGSNFPVTDSNSILGNTGSIVVTGQQPIPVDASL